MKSKKEVKEYLEEIKEDQDVDADDEEYLIMDIQIETLEWVLR
jgi:hypothetical protein